MDDTNQYILSKIKSSEFLQFGSFCKQLKLVHRSLDGIGINYNQAGITSIKAYCKILDLHPKFPDDFSGWLGENKEVFYKLCNLASSKIKDRNDGLSGINIALKLDCITNEYTKSLYVKTKKNKCLSINFNDQNKMQERTYNYIFNKKIVFLINHLFRMQMPSFVNSIEFSKRENGFFATAYPVINKNKSDKLSGARLSCESYFKKLNCHKTWEIEREIAQLPILINPKLTPITKGYQSLGKSRKMFFGVFSSTLSTF